MHEINKNFAKLFNCLCSVIIVTSQLFICNQEVDFYKMDEIILSQAASKESDNIEKIKEPDVNENKAGDTQDEVKTTTLNVAGLFGVGPTHPGRPSNEEPHIKKSMRNKKEKIELICRIDQEELGFQEDDYEDLKALFVVRPYIFINNLSNISFNQGSFTYIGSLVFPFN